MSTTKFELTPANIIAKIISGVVHPMLIPVFGAYIILNLPSPYTSEHIEDIKLGILSYLIVCTLAVPTAVIVLLRYTGVVQSVSLNDQKDRRMPFILIGICYTVCYWLIKHLEIPGSFFPLNMAEPILLGATLLVVISLIVNHWFKISIHMMSIGGLLGSMIAISLRYYYDLNIYILPMAVVAGLVGFARLQLNAHTPAQVYTGFLTGALVNGGVILLYGNMPGVNQ